MWSYIDRAMKIWVLNPPFLKKYSRPQRSPAVTKSGTIYFPIWLAYCAGVLEKAGHDVTLTDAPARGIELQEILKLAETMKPQLIVMDTSTPSIQNDLNVAADLKKAFPKTFIVMVGTHVSAMTEETMQRSAAVDAIARREYEYTVRELAAVLAESNVTPATECRSYKDGIGRVSCSSATLLAEGESDFGSGVPELQRENVERAICNSETLPAEKGVGAAGVGLEKIAGLSFRSNGDIIHNPDRPFIENLDELPWVSKVYEKFLRIEDYFNPNALYPMVTLTTSRGCPFRCSFCVYPQTLTGRKYRFRSIDDVLGEMEFVTKEFPEAKSIFFEDDTLTANKKRCMEFAEAIIAKGIKIPWTANSRVELDLEGLKKIRAAGCRQLCVGFESGDQNMLNTMRKGTTTEKMFQFVQDARKAGILIHGCFMLGFPGETQGSIEKTIELAIKLEPDTVQFYPVMVYPGTEAYSEYKEKGWLTARDYSEWLTPEGLHNCVVRNENFTSAELVRLCDLGRRRFYLRPGYMAYKAVQMLAHPGEIGRTFKAARTFARHLLRGSGV